MRTAIALLALVLSGCVGAYHTSSDGRLEARIDAAYAARDACLARNAAAEEARHGGDGVVARNVALACTSETERLIEVINRDGDPRVAANIRSDSEFRARAFVLKARGQSSN